MFWLHRISLASYFPDKYDFLQCTYVNRSWNSFFVEGTHGFYSTSILVHIIGYNLFQFKQIHLGLDQILFECTYELFSYSVGWGENRDYITRNLFSYRTRSLELLFRTIQLAKNKNFHKIIREIPSLYQQRTGRPHNFVPVFD